MEPNGSVSLWIDQLKLGDQLAAQRIWDRYMGQLLRIARGKLRSLPRQAADEEDVALSAFNAFCQGAVRNGFSKLEDRDDLWQLLLVITQGKAANLRKWETRQKRDAGRISADAVVEDQCSPEPTPELACAVAEECQRLLDVLGDDDLRFVAVHKLQGYTNEEIAAKLGQVTRSVERRLQLIRRIWKQAQDGTNE